MVRGRQGTVAVDDLQAVAAGHVGVAGDGDVASAADFERGIHRGRMMVAGSGGSGGEAGACGINDRDRDAALAREQGDIKRCGCCRDAEDIDFASRV